MRFWLKSEDSSDALLSLVINITVADSTCLCAIQECQNPCHVDENGVVHECCGYTHAMEHQRRQAMQQGL